MGSSSERNAETICERCDKVAATLDKAVLEETKQVLRRYLERTLSQNDKNPTAYMKPEGYHKLKQDGKLPLVQRQQSKPERTKPSKRDSPRRKSLGTPTISHQNAGNWSGGPASLYSLCEITSSANNNVGAECVVDGRVHARRSSELDLRTMQRLSESDRNDVPPENSIMSRLLRSHPNGETILQSYESLYSCSEDGSSKMRRKSFTRAVTRKPVVSSRTEQRKSATTASGNSIHSGDYYRAVVRRPSVAEVQPDAPESSSRLSGDRTEKKLSFRERMKRIIPSKKKLKYKRATEMTRSDDVDDQTRTGDSKARSAGPRMMSSIDQEFNREIERKAHSATASDERVLGFDQPKPPHGHKENGQLHSRTPSPAKYKSPHLTPKFLHRAFSHIKSSPKPKRRAMHQSNSSHSLSLSATMPTATLKEQMERNKSGSLPSSLRFGVNQPQAAAGRRQPSHDAMDPKTQLASANGSPLPHSKHSSHHDHHHHHHHHHHHDHHHHDHDHEAGSKKVKGMSKIRKLFRRFRKRHASESSTASSRSQSLPSLPAALEQEAFSDINERPSLTNDTDLSSKTGEFDSLPSPGDISNVHLHRHSLSLSSVHLDGLSDPEKQKVYDEIAESLNRLSTKFAKYMQKRSSVQAGQVLASETFPSNQNQESKTTRPNSPQPQSNNLSPSLTAYYNLSPRKRPNDSRLNNCASVMPGSTPPRRTFHSKSKSLPVDSFRGDLSVPCIVLQEPSPTEPECPFADATETVDEATMGEDADENTPPSDQVDAPGPTLGDRLYVAFHGSDVDRPTSFTWYEECALEDRASTSKAECEDMNGLGGLPREEVDEEKLVQLLVEALRRRGDELQEEVDMPNGLPLSPSVLNFISSSTYSTFSNFARRFCTDCRRLVKRSPTRHPDIFPVLMATSMIELIVANYSFASQTFDRIFNYTNRFLADILRDSGISWDTIRQQLQDTEDELSEAETSTSQEKRPSPDDEVD